MTMRDFSLSSSDHILAQGVKFWTSVVEDHQIEQLEQCYQIITALGQFLTTLNSSVYKETVDTMEDEDAEKATNGQGIPLSVMKSDDPVKTDDQQEDVIELLKMDNMEDEDGENIEIVQTDDPVKTDEQQNDNQSSNNEKDEKTTREDSKEPLKVDKLLSDDKSFSASEETGDNDKDSDADLDDLFNVIECSDELLEDILPEGGITDQEKRNFRETKRKTVKTEEEGGGEMNKKSCEYCGENLPSLYNMANHISSYHNEFLEDFKNKYETISCAQCPFKCYTKRRIQKHMYKNHPKKACDQCEKSFYHDKDLRKHKEKHEDEGKSFNCEKCSKVFTERKKFEIHSIRHELQFKCKICGKILGDKFTLKSHLKKHHRRTEDSLICTICGKILKTTRGMKKHIEMFHEDHEKHEKCRYCELLFDTYNKKVGHEFEVHNYNSHVCVFCGKKIRKRDIDIHMTTHANRNIPCEIEMCGKVFRSQKHRERHHDTVHKPDSEKPYKRLR